MAALSLTALRPRTRLHRLTPLSPVPLPQLQRIWGRTRRRLACAVLLGGRLRYRSSLQLQLEYHVQLELTHLLQ